MSAFVLLSLIATVNPRQIPQQPAPPEITTMATGEVQLPPEFAIVADGKIRVRLEDMRRVLSVRTVTGAQASVVVTGFSGSG